METTLKLKIRKDYVRKSDGFGQVYLYVRIDKEKQLVELELHWPPNLLDETANQLLPRKKNDKECHDYNLIIRNAIAKANDILIECRLQNREITMKQFLVEYKEYEKRKDFCNYMATKIAERHKRNKITEATKKSHENALIWLKRFQEKITYQQLTSKFIEKFEGWLLKQENQRANDKKKLDQNTVSNILKYIKAYINLAINKDKVPIENPFTQSDVRIGYEQKTIEFLMPSEVADLMHIYKYSTLPIGEQLTLCRFLIACLLSLRISDIMKLNATDLALYEVSRKISFQPKKQRIAFKLKTVHVPIDDIALGYLRECVSLSQAAQAAGLKIGEEYGRKVLRKIGARYKINLKGFHQGRHTFATNYLRAGGKVYNLQQIMGHSDLNTTMMYVHVIEEDMQEEMLQLSNFYTQYKK